MKDGLTEGRGIEVVLGRIPKDIAGKKVGASPVLKEKGR